MNESVIYLPQVGSTNAWAKENIAQFGPVGAVYTTDQTAGRGRLGRGWVDAPGKGLYYTAVIKTDLAQPSTLPLFASLAVCDALKQRYGIDCQIKWPNDLLLNGKKIVGILCEVAPDGHSLVVGIGINLNTEIFPEELSEKAGSLGCRPDRSILAAEIASQLHAFAREPWKRTFMQEYTRRSMVLGRRVVLDCWGARTEGVAVGFDENGGLFLDTGKGEPELFTGGEISLRLSGKE